MVKTDDDDGWVLVPNMSPQIVPELFADVEEPEDVSVSHSGKWVVYSLRTLYCRAKENVVASLWIAQAGKKHSARQLTAGMSNDHSPTFSPDGKHVAFLSDRANPGKAADIYLLPLQGGEALRLTPPSDEKPTSSYKWNPRGLSIAYLKSEEDTDKQKPDKDRTDPKVYGQDWDLDRLHLVCVATKEVEILPTGKRHVSQFDWNHDGSQIVFTTTNAPDIDTIGFGPADIVRLDVDSQSVEILYTTQTPPMHLSWSDSGLTWVQCVDDATLISAQGVFAMPACPNGKASPAHVAHGSTDCAFSLRDCSGKAVVHVAKGLRDRLQVLGSMDALAEGDCRISSWDVKFHGRNSTVAVSKGSTGVPAEVFSVEAGEYCQLSEHGSKIAEMEIGTSSLVEDTAADGLPIDGFYCIPRTLKADFDAKKPLPTVVYIHGGPYWRATDGFNVDFFSPSWFMAQGYLVLVANYRGGMGHGNDYATAIRDNAAASYQDVVALVKKGVGDGHVDKNRAAIFGWSQGGYLSYLAVTRDSEFHFAAAIPGAGVTEWASMAMTSDVPTIEGALSGNLPWTVDFHFIGDRKASPIYHMQDIKTPVLILHGEEDARVPVSQAISFHRGMRARNLPCEMVIYPREGHGNFPGFERAHYIDMMKRMKTFLDAHIG